MVQEILRCKLQVISQLLINKLQKERTFYSGHEYDGLEARGGVQLGHGQSGRKIQSNIAG